MIAQVLDPQVIAQQEFNAHIQAQANLIAPESGEDDHRGSGRIYCTHPNAIRYPQHTYRAIAQIRHQSGRRATADVVVINPCKAAIDKCLDAVLGGGWYTVDFEWADVCF